VEGVLAFTPNYETPKVNEMKKERGKEGGEEELEPRPLSKSPKMENGGRIKRECRPRIKNPHEMIISERESTRGKGPRGEREEDR